MREIKFRAWHEGHKIFSPKMIYDEKPGDCLVWKNQGQNISDIMQYTGLHDKNGKEIYEGDIVQTETKELFVVIWGIDCAFWFHSVKKYEGEYFGRRFGDFKHYVYVVGNIHENPELLK